MSKVLNKSSEKLPTDKLKREVIGEMAVKDYNEHYKKLKRVQEEN